MMAPNDSVPCVIHHFLSSYQYEDAIFLAERYHAEVDTPHSLWLLATSYFGHGQVTRACFLLKSNIERCDAKCVLLYLRCCKEQRTYTNGLAIMNQVLGRSPSESAVKAVFKEDSSLAFWLLGELCRQAKLTEKAVQYYRLSLHGNPFTWSAFQALCELGDSVNTSSFFSKGKCPAFLSRTEEAPPPPGRPGAGLEQGTSLLSQDNRGSRMKPGLLFNLAVGGATASSTPRLTDTSDFLLKRVAFKDEASLGTPSTPFAWSVEHSEFRVGRVGRELDRGDLGSTATALHFTPEDASAPPGVAHSTPVTHSTPAVTHSTPVEPHAPDVPHQQSVPSIARVAWSSASLPPAVASLDLDHSDEYPSEDSLLAMPPPKAPLKASAPRRSTRISDAIARGNHMPSIGPRHRPQPAHPPLGGGGFGSVSPLRSDRFKFSPGRKSPRKTGMDDRPSSSLQSTRRTLTFSSKPSAAPQEDCSAGMASSTLPPADKAAQVSALEGLLGLVGRLAQAYHALSRYDLPSCVALLRSLPHCHLRTAWVQSCIAMAYFFAERYQQAADVFAEVHRSDPHLQEGMDCYSSVLWQLKRGQDLQVLALDLEGTCPASRQTWCALGNSKSSAGDHRGALQCFNRAVKASPRYWYGMLLAGLEQSNLEEPQAATESFMDCLAEQPRCVQGWAGLGMVCLARDRCEEALAHYSKALAINRFSAVVSSQLGMILVRLHRELEGLACIDRAIHLNPKLPIARFNKSLALQATGHVEDALRELKTLAKLCPREPKILLQIGKMLYGLERSQEAVQYFSLALNADPSSTAVRQEIDSVLQLQGATVRRGPDLSMSAQHSGFQGLEEESRGNLDPGSPPSSDSSLEA